MGVDAAALGADTALPSASPSFLPHGSLKTAENAVVPQPPTDVISAELLCLTLARTALENDLPIDFFTRLIWRESRFRANAVSYAGAQGIAQFMPSTAADRGLDNPFDPITALRGAGKFLKQLRAQFGNLGLAAAYNAGPGRVEAWLARRAALPRETRIYVWSITKIPVEQWIGQEDKPEHRLGSTISCDAVAKLLLPRTRKGQERPVHSQGR